MFAAVGRRVEGVCYRKIQAQAVLLQSLRVSGSTVRLVAQPSRADHRRPLRCPFARAARFAHSLRQAKALYEGTAVRGSPLHPGGPMEPSDGRLLTERLLFKPKVDVLSARRVALLCDLGATLEHRARRRIRCPPTREGLGFEGISV